MQAGKTESLQPIPTKQTQSTARQWLDRLWLLFLVAALVITTVYVRSGDFCAYLATDFRGYYASAQIALQAGFSQVYDQALQNATQDALPLQCPYLGLEPPRLHVSMPYLPVYVLLFLPLTALPFTNSYLLFSLLNLVILALYLLRFSRALGLRPDTFKLLQWTVCLSLLANLSLGQINVFLVICLGEFILAYVKGRQVRAGLWLAAMLIKPYILFLLLAGLAVSRRWRVLYGFGAGSSIALGCSLLLAGVSGVAASLEMAIRFAGPLIQTGATMMNWRALALNLGTILPGWMAWAIAGLGMVIVAVLALREWPNHNPGARTQFFLLVLATLCTTFTLSWHSHFYLLILLIPLLLSLDQEAILPVPILAVWALGPLGLFFTVFLLQPELARNILGNGYLGLNLLFLTWAIRTSRQISST